MKKGKTFYKLTDKQKERLIKEHMQFHPAMTAPSEYNMIVRYGHIEVTPKNGNVLHNISKFMKFADYYGASVYVDVEDGVPTLVIC